ncbi:MAG: DGQHR domain-containing protein [Proteobacteria bacterium]|nr:DGQHR domain-containing protein [Pseudomonadota bacterium]
MKKQEHHSIILPALCGNMGSWVYYICLMPLDEIACRVQYAKEIHEYESMSEMIQRDLKNRRGKDIAEYLTTQDERFFNSLVVASYGGQPNWHALSDVKTGNRKELKELEEVQIASLGFLTLRGDEDLFALDGQHRLAGIRRVFKNGKQNSSVDEVSVIFVAHHKTSEGLRRTRRLFTTLNKTAKPVSKGEIIALDEDDVMAIITRRLVEDFDALKEERVAFVPNNNIPVNNKVCLTTIGNLYDILGILFADTHHELKKRDSKKAITKADLKKTRPTDKELDAYFNLAKKYFALLGKNFKELNEFFTASNTEFVVGKYRGGKNDNIVFRPIGLNIFTQIIATLTEDLSLEEAVKRVAKLPRLLSQAPYQGLLWNLQAKRIISTNNVLVRDILLYMLGAFKKSESALLEKYRKELDDPKASLPDKIK